MRGEPPPPPEEEEGEEEEIHGVENGLESEQLVASRR